jgi:hypothetical protein
MHVRRDGRSDRSKLIVFIVSLFVLLGGCETAPWGDLGGGVPDPSASLVIGGEVVHAGFPAAARVRLPQSGEVWFEGEITHPDDVNVFALGRASAGDRIIVEVLGDGGLNTVAALFNHSGELIDLNDDRSYYAGRLDPLINVIVRQDDSNLLLGVAISRARYFAHREGRYDTGTYRVRVDRQPGQAFEVRPQWVWVEFGGAYQVRIAQEAAVDVPAFDAGRIADRLAGQTEFIKDLVIEKMRADFEPFNVFILRSDVDTPPTEDVYTTIYIGGYDGRFLGLADNVDSYNKNRRQKAIIFAETLGLFEGMRPSPASYAQALANVAAHELGHLLGLHHTADPTDLMAEAASAQAIFFVDAGFRVSALNSDLFPVGAQNGPQQLALALGWPSMHELMNDPNPNARERSSDPELWQLDDAAPAAGNGPAGRSLNDCDRGMFSRQCNRVHRH